MSFSNILALIALLAALATMIPAVPVWVLPIAVACAAAAILIYPK